MQYERSHPTLSMFEKNCGQTHGRTSEVTLHPNTTSPPWVFQDLTDIWLFNRGNDIIPSQGGGGGLMGQKLNAEYKNTPTKNK